MNTRDKSIRKTTDLAWRDAIKASAARRALPALLAFLSWFAFLANEPVLAAQPHGQAGVPVPFPPLPIVPPPVVPPQFDVTGFIQAATLDTVHAICTPTDPHLTGGTLTVNDITITVPC